MVKNLKMAKEVRVKILEYMKRESPLQYQEVHQVQDPKRSADGRMKLPMRVGWGRDIRALIRFVETLISPCDFSTVYNDRRSCYFLSIYYGTRK